MQAATTSHGPAARQSDSPRTPDKPERLARLRRAIEEAAHLLPTQGPITTFVHHNTLHALEELPFDAAVTLGGRLYGCQPYLSEDRFREELARGRIRSADLDAVLREELGESGAKRIGSLVTRFELRRAMLRFPVRAAPDAELRWFVAQTDALAHYRADVPAEVRQRFLEQTRHWIMRDVRGGTDAERGGSPDPQRRRDQDALADLLRRFGESSVENWNERTWERFSLQALWRICRHGVHGVKTFAAAPPASERHRDVLLEATGEDTDRLVDGVLIRFCAAYLDQGFATCPLPARDEGFYESFCALYGRAGGPPDRWMRGLPKELARLEGAGLGPIESILESLQWLGVAEQEWDEFITATLLSLRGWAGMIRQMELRADQVVRPAPPGSLVGYLAIRLVLERWALAFVAREALGFREPLARLRDAARARIPKHQGPSVEHQAFLVFQVAQMLGWSPGELHRLSKPEWTALLAEIESFGSLERRRILHRAYERRYYTQTLDALAVHAQPRPRRIERPRFQVTCCIDEREESFRRHVEELCPDAETFSVAGFYGIAMFFRGAADAHFTALCPAVVRPKHWVVEEAVYSLEESHRLRAAARRALGTASHQLHVGSRTFAGGAFVAAALGVLATLPLVARVLSPRLTAILRRATGRLVQPPPVTRLQLERLEATPGPEDGRFGYSLDEMAGVVETVLRDLGLTSGLARLVFTLGHGSVSLNNPHESAHDCGACAGNRGGPNGRALAQMANDPRIRERLRSRGLDIPAEAWFIGGMHNTCDDSLTLYDLDRLPKSHRQEFEQAREILEQACDRDAHERSRRFESAPLALTARAARRHVEGRSEDLAETRPEYGHASNAITIVGRRSRTRGLFLDRRAFLNSYDPEQDDENHTILARILAAAVPVCAGISLEYYFSYVDPTGWGCGTKLPHNIASLLGVMNGAASDLRPGLPWQMVEIHEPMRHLFVIETTAEVLLRIMNENDTIGRLCRNEWACFAVLDPDSPRIQIYRNGAFEPYDPEATQLPRADSSLAWYRGWRDHLEYAGIRQANSAGANVEPWSTAR